MEPAKLAGHKCVYYNCFATRRNTKDLRMFKFPVKNLKVLRTWIINCGNASLIDLPLETLKNRFVCGLHFNENDFRTKKGHFLRKQAVPKKYSLSEDLDYAKPYITYLNETDAFVFEEDEPKIDEESLDAPMDQRDDEEIHNFPSGRLSPVKTMLMNKLRLQAKKLINCKRSMKRMKMRHADFKRTNLARLVSSPGGQILVGMQLRKCKVHEWSEGEREFATSLYNTSTSAYRFLLNRGIILPAPSTIKDWRIKNNLCSKVDDSKTTEGDR